MHSRAVKSHKARQRRGTFCLICGGPGGYFYAPAVLDSCPRPVQWLARPPRAPGAKLVQPLSFFCCVSKSAGCYPPRTTNVRCLSWEGASGLSVERAGGAAALETPPPPKSVLSVPTPPGSRSDTGQALLCLRRIHVNEAPPNFASPPFSRTPALRQAKPNQLCVQSFTAPFSTLPTAHPSARSATFNRDLVVLPTPGPRLHHLF